MGERIYIAIDLKSFYASVECMARGLDPMTTNLVVADTSRTEKTICLAVSPSLRACGIPGRARLFEVVQKVRELNALRLARAKRKTFSGESVNATELAQNPALALSYIAAPPRMAHYIACSSKIYSIYLKYIAPEDIHVYSIDEVFMDVTDYLRLYQMSAEELAMKMILDVLHETGITATAGIGTNLYLAKIAMDIRAKHIPPDENGVRIAKLDELSYRKLLWEHQPITDFWRIGRGYAQKLKKVGIRTMGEVARCSIGKPNDFYNEELLYKLFGINAELLIDHAWGWEPCTIADIKAYRPSSSSVSSGQVLQCPYSAEKAHLVICEMAEQMALDLFEKHLTTDQLVLTVGYDAASKPRPGTEITVDLYGRRIPKHAQGTQNLPQPTASMSRISDAASTLYQRIINPDLLVRRLTLCANHILPETDSSAQQQNLDSAWGEQLNLFDYVADGKDIMGRDAAMLQKEREYEASNLKNERQMQESLLAIKQKFGKNAVFKGRDLEEGATTIQRNKQIGGHKA